MSATQWSQLQNGASSFATVSASVWDLHAIRRLRGGKGGGGGDEEGVNLLVVFMVANACWPLFCVCISCWKYRHSLTWKGPLPTLKATQVKDVGSHGYDAHLFVPRKPELRESADVNEADPTPRPGSPCMSNVTLFSEGSGSRGLEDLFQRRLDNDSDGEASGSRGLRSVGSKGSYRSVRSDRSKQSKSSCGQKKPRRSPSKQSAPSSDEDGHGGHGTVNLPRDHRNHGGAVHPVSHPRMFRGRSLSEGDLTLHHRVVAFGGSEILEVEFEDIFSKKDTLMVPGSLSYSTPLNSFAYAKPKHRKSRSHNRSQRSRSHGSSGH